MQKILIWDKNYFDNILSKIRLDWLDKLHILADFDRTLTKAFSNWQIRPSLISVLRSEWYLWEEYSKEAYKLFNYYNPIEINPSISIEEKKKEMMNWRNKHRELLIKSKLNKKDIEKVISSWIIEFRDWIIEFLKFLENKNIPIVIISANWLWTDSIKLFFEKKWVLTKNVNIISNSFVWDQNWFAIWYDKNIIHVFNKDETVLEKFPEIHNSIKNRTNVILLWDSLWDVLMIEWFQYENLLKIWFLNEKVEELLEEYRKNYDVVLTWDSDALFLNNLLK